VILVDTSVWVEHLRRRHSGLAGVLERERSSVIRSSSAKTPAARSGTERCFLLHALPSAPGRPRRGSS
jgi:hypothetical protein